MIDPLNRPEDLSIKNIKNKNRIEKINFIIDGVFPLQSRLHVAFNQKRYKLDDMQTITIIEKVNYKETNKIILVPHLKEFAFCCCC